MNTRRIALVVVVVAVVCSAGHAVGATGPLFRAADGFLAAAMGIEGVARYRAVSVDVARLRTITPDGLDPAPAVWLNLFDDVLVRANLEHAEPTPTGGWLWRGTVESPSTGSAILAFDAHTLSGSVVADGRRFQIRNDGGPVHLVRELAP